MNERKHPESQDGEPVICELDISSDSGLRELKILVKDSKFVCKDCGRAAAREESLCEPEWIY